MNSLYAKYIYELEKIISVESDCYFFNYKLVGDEFHVYEIYILPEYRSSEVSVQLANLIEQMASESGAKFLVGFVHRAHENHEISLKFQQKRGMRIIEDDGSKITLMKEVLRE